MKTDKKRPAVLPQDEICARVYLKTHDVTGSEEFLR